MARQLFPNNARSTIADVGGISDAALSVDVESGHGALFGAPTNDDYVLVTLAEESGGVITAWEVVKCTAVSGDTLTIERAYEGAARAFAQGDLIFAGITAATLGYVRDIAKPRLTGDTTFYVATTGSDSNDGLDTARPFLTIQKAIDVAAGYDLNGYVATIQLADGTYATTQKLRALTGAGSAVIQGNAGTPANVHVAPAASYGFGAGAPDEEVARGTWILKNMKISTGGTNCVQAGRSGYIRLGGGIVFGAAGVIHMVATGCGVLDVRGNYAVDGAAVTHWYTASGGQILVGGMTLTFNTNPTAFATNFASANSGGGISCSGMTFTNKAYATGKRYDAVANGVIDTGGGGATYLPGTVAGATATGGQYV